MRGNYCIHKMGVKFYKVFRKCHVSVQDNLKCTIFGANVQIKIYW